MAGRILSTRRNFARQIPLHAVWLWCIVINSLTSLPCVSSSCQGIDIGVEIQPEGLINILQGEPLEIFCVTEKNTALVLEFMKDGKRLHSDIVNSTTRRLYMENMESQITTIYCQNLVTRKTCVTRIIVDLPPLGVTDFDCMSKNIEQLYCTWTSTARFAVVNYSVTYGVYDYNILTSKIFSVENRRNRQYTLLLNTTSIPRYRQMEEWFYFYLTACNIFGCTTQNFTVSHYSIVKPDPPLFLRVVSSDSNSVQLQWDISYNIIDFLPCPLVHKIEYREANIDNSTLFVSADVSDLPPRNKSFKYTLSNLRPHSTYEVRVYIKSELATRDKFWSDFASVILTTDCEMPERPPETFAGAFHQGIFENTRIIYVYWIQLNDYDSCGANFSYKVVVSQGSQDSQVVYPDKNKSLSHIVLSDASFEAIHVSVWSVNEHGTSAQSSQLYIPPKHHTDSLSVHSFTNIDYGNGTYRLSWIGLEDDGAQKFDNYTLLWCRQELTHICTGRVHFTVLDPRLDRYVIELPADKKYQFAIAANKGSKTSGMTWPSCEILRDSTSLFEYPISLRRVVSGKTFLKITWSTVCTLTEGIVSGYLISYCPILEATTGCDPSFGNASSHYVAASDQIEIHATNLQPQTTYQFTLAVNTTRGLKPNRHGTVRVTTAQV